jgi:CheY-like chemotaxis protein/predicted regulator of Ras-like GTPase activity (Roadblock/LC7/MglB family)
VAMSDEANKILVVDDSPQVCKALNDVLKASGYQARTAPSAERALQIIETDHFDLVITDLKMSGMNGMDLAKKIFEQMPGVPVVILTGFGDMDAVIGALRSGVADFLKKPFSIDEVLSVVRRELAKGQAYPPALAPVRTPPQPDKPPRLYIFAPPDLEQIDTVLSKLRAQAGADSALLVEQAGYVITAKGLVNNADLETISNLIAGTRSTSASLASLLGESQDFSTSYMEGQRVSVYNTALGRGLYLVVIVPKGTRQGLVWLYAKEAAVEIDRIVQQATEVMQKQVGHSIGVAETEVLHQEMADQKVENVFKRKSPPPPVSTPRPAAAPPPSPVSTPRPAATTPPPPVSPPRPAATPPPSPALTPRPAAAPRSSIRPLGTVSTISFKKDRSASEAVPNHAPAKAAGSPAPSAPSPEPVGPVGPSISFEEALKMGLLNFDGAPSSEPPAAAEPTGVLSPDTFAAALSSGLLNFNAAAPAEELAAAAPSEHAASSAGTLTPDSFADALKRGLLNFGSD